MGRIAEYQSRQLASSVVGVPQQDRSGEIIASGLQQGVMGIVGLMAEQKQEKEALDGSLASNAYTEEMGTRIPVLQKMYEKDPMKFPSAAKEEADKVAMKMTADMEPGLANKFKVHVAEFSANMMPAATGWAIKIDEALNISKVKQLYIDEAKRGDMVKSAQGLLAIKKRFEIVDQKAGKWMDSPSVSNLHNTYWPQAQKAFVSDQLMNTPLAFMSGLKRGEYNELFTRDEVAELLPKALSAATFNQKVGTIFNLVSKIPEVQEIHQTVLNGTSDIKTINLKLDAALAARNAVDDQGAPVVSEEYIDGLRRARDAHFMFNEEQKPGVRKAESKILAKDIIDKWEGTVKDEAKQDGVDDKDFRQMFKVYNDLFGAYVDGTITDADYQDAVTVLEKRVQTSIPKSGQKAKYTQGLADAVLSAGKRGWFLPKAHDVYSLGYKTIREDIDKMNITAPEKNRLKLRYMAAYTRAIDATPPELLPTKPAGIEQKVKEVWLGRNDDKGNQVMSGLKATMYKKNVVKNINGRAFTGIQGPEGGEMFVLDKQMQKGLMFE